MALPPFLTAIVGWLRAGYPEGVPPQDYVPLLALLSTQLGDTEAAAIADELAATSDPTSREAIRAAIRQVTQLKPTEADVARVRAHLAAGGWPLAKPERQPAGG